MPKSHGKYIKGDQHSGGGGGVGGGGKKHRPVKGWEKGDVVRDVDARHGEGGPKRKPRRKPAQERGERRRHRHLGEST
ncbi:MAG: hypothetical protein M5U28_18300 [Sandaracinaceae bacterium]|nr:hypothetical protein [Sandaracinaceae bacterium]